MTTAPPTVAAFMAAANAAYYAARDPLGAAGDFITAPEISQMFGELIGLSLADAWARAGRPDPILYVELGPGRGTLAADALRAMAAAGLRPQVHLVETSPALRAIQAARVPQAVFHDAIDTLPDNMPILLVANEFFDALPVHQYERTAEGWRERMVVDNAPVPLGEPVDRRVPVELDDAEPGAVLERAYLGPALLRALARRMAIAGGAGLVIDYGFDGPALGDTLQAVRGHRPVSPFVNPGSADLTAHVDFAALAGAARDAECTALPRIGQGAFLSALGIDQRLAVLTRSAPARADEIAAARDRLVAPDAMGTLFRVMGLHGPEWSAPAGCPA